MRLLKTWIDSLDEFLGGGLPDKSLVLMTGEPGSGHDVLAQQILYQNAVHMGRVAYLSTFRDSDALKEDFEAFGWNVTPLQENGNWLFLDAHSPNAAETLLKEIPAIMANGRWILLDSLSYLILTQPYKSVINIVELLSETAKKIGGIHFLLLTQKMQAPEIETAIQHLADGVIQLSALEIQGGIDRRMKIKKMQRVVYEPRLIPFNITENGIAIETAVRIT